VRRSNDRQTLLEQIAGGYQDALWDPENEVASMDPLQVVEHINELVQDIHMGWVESGLSEREPPANARGPRSTTIGL